MDRIKPLQAAHLVSSLKNGLRRILGPGLPLIRSLRTYPERRKAEKHAARLEAVPGLSVCYLTSGFPQRPALRTEIARGGAVKLTFLAESFPHAYPRASLLYTVSSIPHPGQAQIVRRARQNGLKVVINQNGVAYPAWHGSGWELPNQKQRETYTQADFIVYQSEFCQRCAEIFLGKTAAPSVILYNPVDTLHYQPAREKTPHAAPVLLLGGNQYEQYRFENAAQTLKSVLQRLPGATLLVTGQLWGDDQSLAMEAAQNHLRKLGIAAQVRFTGSYSQEAAPGIFQSADILIHTKYNDPSPNLISEALACGLPVVYSASGGVPELVGPEAGIGLPVEPSWEKISLPDPEQMAEAVLTVWENQTHYAEAARQNAVERFSLEKYVQAHRELFMRVLD
jgi:glycosyltransferase involved in cell wall biosynthesis